MSKREVELFIFDIYIAILKIEYTVEEVSTAQELLHDFKSWDSVIREFEIIGEASKHLLKNELMDKKYQVVVDFRNLIIHEYFGIDSNEVYDIAINDLPHFKDEIDTLIYKIDNDLRLELKEAYLKDNAYLGFIVTALSKLK